MRIIIESNDRIGISQEILQIFAQRAWNIRSTEVITGFTYVHLEDENLLFDDVKRSLLVIRGIIQCREIDLMPSESRENHLQTLLDRIPNPIIDIDESGHILAINKATKSLLSNLTEKIEGQPINRFIDQDVNTLLTDKVTSCSLLFHNQAYLAEIHPVVAYGLTTGIVITLTSMGSLGRELSILQSKKNQGIDCIIGECEKIQLLKQQTIRFAELDLPVLINGETGTGKELIARALHQSSQYNKAAFLAINCATLPEHLLESELFGYAAGAFTGAQKGGKPGLFELADGGTLFLDEVAEMSVYLQAKLLRFLQDFTFRRVGGNREVKVKVRIISATHQDLPSLIEQKRFREDLYYRLNVLNLTLPPLRERKDDIPLLAQHFIQNAAHQVNQTMPSITVGALALLQNHRWPGNIRQLQNTLFRIVALNSGESIDPSHIKLHLNLTCEISASENPEPDNNQINADHIDSSDKKTKTLASVEADVLDWQSAQARFERELLQALYPLYPSTRKLAQRLNVSHNKIAMKLKEHGIIK
jgi:transcriptional regulator of aroF, aroG, tyrA and aromatic amino acid transport